ncbi:MAG: DUF1588 domain-containing protein [Planctomycetota bacterium]
MCISWGSGNVAAEETYTPQQPVPRPFRLFAKSFLNDHCLDCHGTDDPAGGLSLDDLGPPDPLNAETWKSVWAQVALREMPPNDADQPETIARLQFVDWVVDALSTTMKGKGGFHAHRDPDKANFVDHDLLFGPLPDGITLRPTSSPARIWRVTPQAHITRLNELINVEPPYDPSAPGKRTRGDVVPTNHGGELKLYFGTDRILRWQGGTVAYATSVKSVPVVLSSNQKHGFEDYPDFYSVNSAEATQIMGVAGDIIRYMAYGPLSIANPEQITDDPRTYHFDGDLRGLPTAIVYSTQMKRPQTPVYELMRQEGVDDSQLRRAVDYLFQALTFRTPSSRESDQYLELVRQSIQRLGKEDGVVLGLSSIFLDRDALFRPELAQYGTPDAHGRVMLQDWELGLALNHAFKYIPPDETLVSDINEGRMRTIADVRRHAERMLSDDSIRKPRILRFFRDYFDHDLGGYICKDAAALGATGVRNRGESHYRAMFNATASTDRLIELVLQEDRDVLKRLLTTDQFVAARDDGVYFGVKRTRAQAAEAARKDKSADAHRDAQSAVKELQQWIKDHTTQDQAQDRKAKQRLAAKRRELSAAKKREIQAKRARSNVNHSVQLADLSGDAIFARVSRRSFGNGSLKPERTLATVADGQRLGILTHPSWLVSHSDAMDNHAIRRGRWIRERLLGGGIPDVPITVDAMLPDDPKRSLRDRMRVTREDYCWTCHKKMDPLGLPFEQYNHAGLFRTTELGQPVDTSGEIIESGDPALDGPVENPMEMIRRLADSQRVEQVFVRHAFRFWMGRNETLNDAPVLQDAHRAYRQNGGSMKALLVSLLTSDAFLYRSRQQK